MQSFNPHATHPARAIQAWQILISRAMNRQTITYQALGQIMFHRQAAGVLAQILVHIAFYCIDNGLPPLTTIVVGTDRGTPGADIPVNPVTIDEERERVYQQDWYNLYPPSEADLRAAYSGHMR